ncbi:S26 family signal peptidase [Nonomuraea muscovyensis]|uniref:signal peptidase I n=1 Tax=Nonomuraea muscovyensis TaxID=1124761 RepID=A0A7X0EYH1_9ACTN|nr:S26 family signal peptidase [Nonomuraea muscovyensis]MBB6345785.1 signal peptidase I [Nonomuraea muscovyensis]
MRAAVSLTVLLAAAVAGVSWLRRRYVLVTVSGASMEPAYGSGDRVWVRRVPAGEVRAGQVVVVRLPHPESADAGPEQPWSIKRATAAPGDPVPRDGVPGWEAGARVPPGCLVVRGDNAGDSYDSRHCGHVPGDRLLGVVVRRVRAVS